MNPINRMKTKTAGFLVLILLFSTMMSCATLFVKGGADYRRGEREFEKGQYATAAASALEALGKNPEFPEAFDLLKRSMEIGTEELLHDITSEEFSGDEFRFDRIWRWYLQLDRLHRVVGNSDYSTMFEINSFTAELQDARLAAAEIHYEVGLELLSYGDFRAAREAAGHFEEVREAVPDYLDTDDLLNQAREAGIARILIYSEDGNIELEDALVQSLRSDRQVRDFTRFFRPDELGLYNNRSLRQVAERARRDAIDFVLYVESYSSSHTEYDVIDDVAVAGGVLTGRRYVWENQLRLSGRFRMVDVAHGNELVNAQFSAGGSETLTITVTTATDAGSLSHPKIGDGKFRWISVPDISNRDFSEIRSEAVRFVYNHTIDDIYRQRSFSDLQRKFDDMTLILDTDLLYDQASSEFFPLYNSDMYENQSYREHGRELFLALRRYIEDVADRDNLKAQELSPKAADDISRNIIPLLK